MAQDPSSLPHFGTPSSRPQPFSFQSPSPSLQPGADARLDDLSGLYQDPSYRLASTGPHSRASTHAASPTAVRQDLQHHSIPPEQHPLPIRHASPQGHLRPPQHHPQQPYRQQQHRFQPTRLDRRQQYVYVRGQDTDELLSEESWHDSQTPTQASSPVYDNISEQEEEAAAGAVPLRSNYGWQPEQQQELYTQPRPAATYWQQSRSYDDSDSEMDLERSFPRPERTNGAATAPVQAYVYNPQQYPRPGGPGGQAPLINYVTNDWRQNEKFHAPGFTRAPHPGTRTRADYPNSTWGDDDEEVCCCGQDCEEMVRSKAFRRYMIVVVLGILMLSWIIVRSITPDSTDARLRESISKRLRDDSGFFGHSAPANLLGVKQLKQLEPWRVPGSGEDKDGGKASGKRRLIIVGDIHGCATELQDLLQKVNYNEHTDTIVVTGDVLAKGPASLEVLHILMSNNASCVRGNHEDRVLLARRDYHSPAHSKPVAGPAGPDGSAGSVTQKIRHGSTSDMELAADLTPEQAAWLDACPVILDLGPIPGLGPGGTTVVHAGLVPVVPLASQDPFSVLNMRSIDLRSHYPSRNGPPPEYVKGPWGNLGVSDRRVRDRSGRSYMVGWPALWDAWQSLLEPKDRKAVIYGHDSDLGVALGKHTWGLDGDCVHGGELAALVVAGRGRGKDVDKKVVRVRCQDYIHKDLTTPELGGS